jgi:hypothetical protein
MTKTNGITETNRIETWTGKTIAHRPDGTRELRWEGGTVAQLLDGTAYDPTEWRLREPTTDEKLANMGRTDTTSSSCTSVRASLTSRRLRVTSSHEALSMDAATAGTPSQALASTSKSE